MKRANGCRGQKPPFRIEPELGNPSEDVSQSASAETGDILQEEHRSSCFLSDAQDFWEQPAIVFRTLSIAGKAVGLAGESRSDAIHCLSPGPSVEPIQIRENRARIQVPRFHARRQYRDGIRFPLDHSNCASVALARKVDAEIQSANTRTEGKDSQGPNHSDSPKC